MSKLLVVFGATGNQGGSVLNTVLNDDDLLSQYRLRAVVRNPSKPAAQALQKTGKVEVVQGDADDASSLKHGLKGSHTVFYLTTTTYDDRLEERETAQGTAVADAAVAAGAEYIIFSTLPYIGKGSGGKLKKGGHFDCQSVVEEYIRALPVRSAFFSPGSFMQNFSDTMKPHPAGDGTYVFANFVRPDTKLPLIDISETGKYVAAILADPDRFEGQVMSAASEERTMEDVVKVMSASSGKTVVYKQIPEQVYRGFLPPIMADYLVDMFLWVQDYGYYGPKTKELVAWTTAQARGKLTDLPAYLERHPLKLD